MLLLTFFSTSVFNDILAESPSYKQTKTLTANVALKSGAFSFIPIKYNEAIKTITSLI
jgi:hypothetical protein